MLRRFLLSAAIAFLLVQNQVNALQQINTMADRNKKTKKNNDKINDKDKIQNVYVSANNDNYCPNPSFLFVQNRINALQQDQINLLQQQTIALQQKVDALEKESTALRHQVEEINRRVIQKYFRL